jgi:flagellar export protein FliJ
MAKQVYRLAALLEVRARKKEDAERYLGECLRALKEEQDRQKELEKELERMIADRETKKREYAEKMMRGEMSAQDAIGANKFVERMKEKEELKKEEIENQKKVVRQREQDVEGARKDLIVANQELKALERHKEKWAEALKREAAIKEEEQSDELAQNIFLSKNRPGE